MRKLQLLASALSLAAVAPQSAMAAGPVLDPSVQKFVDGLAGGKPIYEFSPLDARKVLVGLQSVPEVLPAVEMEDRTLPVGPKGSTKIRVIRPKDATGTLPVIVYFHGAGWVMGDTQTHDRLVRELSIGAHAAIVFVDYDRSPEARYPIAIEEDYAVADYVGKHPTEFGVDPSRLAVAGDSVGGNMVAVVTMLAKERGGPAIKSQLLFYPVTSAGMDTASYEQFKGGPWLSKPAMAWFWNAYEPDVSKRADIHISPLNATTEQLRGLPQALVITDENDVLRDEGEAYARKLVQAGVPVVATRYDHTIHDFVLLNAISQTAPTKAALIQAVQFLKSTLGS